MNEDSTPTDSPIPEEFRRIVHEELEQLGFTVTAWQDDGLDCVHSNGEQRSLGLTNLTRRVRGVEPEEARELIQNFLRVLQQVDEVPEEMPEDLNEVRDRLLPRIGPAFPEGVIAPWTLELFGTDLVLNLVIDSESYMRYVPTELMEKSSGSPDEWLSLAFHNLHEYTPEDWLTVANEESGILCGHCNDSYDASRAVILHHLVETGPLGWMICIPTRDLVFAMPVTKEHVESFHLLKLLAENHFHEDPYPISEQVYWVRGTTWEEFNIELDEEGARIYPSDEFIELLELEDELEDLEEDYSDDTPEDDEDNSSQSDTTDQPK